MRKLALIVIALAVAIPAFAGGDTCTAPPEECAAKMKAKLQHSGWLGVEMSKDAEDRPVISGVVPDSPAAAAGFEPGDVLLVMNGVPLDGNNKEALKKAKGAMTPGATAAYTVLRAGREVTLTAVLSTMPEEMAAKIVQKHLQEHHAKAKVAKK